jgi:hypothetical protein
MPTRAPQILQLLQSQPAAGLGLPPSMWAAQASSEDASRRGSDHCPGAAGPGGGAAQGRGMEDRDAAAADVRLARIVERGLAVELPDGIEGRAGLRPARDASGGGGGGAGGGGGGSTHWCASVQEASLVAQWLAAGVEPTSDAVAASAHEVREHLEAGARELQRLMPEWYAAGFLIADDTALLGAG